MMKNKLFSLVGAVRLYLITELLMGLGMGLWVLNLNYYLVERGMSPAAIGGIAAFGSLSMALFSIISGNLCDRLGYRAAMVLGCSIKGLGMILTLIFPSFEGLIFAGIINGVGDSLMVTCSYPYITAMVEETEKTRVYSQLFSVSLFSMFIGNICGGFLVGHLREGYLGVLMLSVLLIGLATVGRRLLPALRTNQTNPGFRVYIPKQQPILLYLIFCFIGYTGFYLSGSMLNLIFRDRLGMTEATAGLMIGFSVLGSSIATYSTTWLTKRFGRKQVSLIVLSVLTISFISMMGIGGIWFAGLSIVSRLLYNMMVGVIDAPMLKIIPEGEKGGFSGIKLLVASVGTSLGSWGAGIFLGVPQGMKWLFGSAAAFVILQIILYRCGFFSLLDEPQRQSSESFLEA